MMIAATIDHFDGIEVIAEGGGWLMLRRAEHGLAGKTPVELLALTANLPGNWRYVFGRTTGVDLLGEMRCDLADVPVGRGIDWLRHRLEQPAAAPDEELVDTLLENTGVRWGRRHSSWVVPAGEGLPREMQITVEPTGARVQAVLVQWDEIGHDEKAALALFLTAAQSGLRFARCELDADGARLASQVATHRVEQDLVHSLAAVATGCRFLEREARALLLPDLARAFRAFHATATNRLGVSPTVDLPWGAAPRAVSAPG